MGERASEQASEASRRVCYAIICAAYLFTVESNGRHGVDVLLELESVESGGFAGRVEAQHDDVDGAMGGDWQGLQKGRRCLAEASAHATELVVVS